MYALDRSASGLGVVGGVVGGGGPGVVGICGPPPPTVSLTPTDYVSVAAAACGYPQPTQPPPPPPPPPHSLSQTHPVTISNVVASSNALLSSSLSPITAINSHQQHSATQPTNIIGIVDHHPLAMTPTSAPPPPSTANGPNNSIAMSQLGTVYATKRRRRNGKRSVFFNSIQYAIFIPLWFAQSLDDFFALMGVTYLSDSTILR